MRQQAVAQLAKQAASPWFAKPLGLATYQLSHSLPAKLQGQLPSIKALKGELKRVGNEGVGNE